MKTTKIIIGLVILATTAFYHACAADSGKVETNADFRNAIIQALEKYCPSKVESCVVTQEVDNKIFWVCYRGGNPEALNKTLTKTLARDKKLRLAADSYQLTQAVTAITQTAIDLNLLMTPVPAKPVSPNPATNALLSLIVTSITNYSSASLTNVEFMAGKTIYPICSAATNYDSLYVQLTTPLTNTDLGLTNSLSLAAADAEISQGTIALQKTPPLLPYMAFISIGAEFNNPYQIISNSLTSSKNSTAGYVQFDYINRFVVRDPAKEYSSQDKWEWGTNEWMGGHFVKPWKVWPDIQGQIGFLFANGGSTSISNYTASTLAGSGDFYAQASADFPVWRQISKDLSLRQQTFIDCSGGFTADDAFYRLHPNMFFGMGYEAAFIPGFGPYSTNMPGFFMGKAGAAWVDTPKFAGNSGSEISTNANDGMPDFDWNVHPAVQVYLAWPLTKSVYLTVEANSYFQVDSQQEASWNVKVGASVPLEKITTIFSSFISN